MINILLDIFGDRGEEEESLLICSGSGGQRSERR